MREERKNWKQLDEDTLAHLDDEQLEEIAGGAKDSDNSIEDETCINITCGCTPTQIH